MDETTLLNKIEATTAAVGLTIGPALGIRPLALEHVRARISPFQHPLINLVGMARLDEATAEEAIDRVIAAYRAEHRLFGWLVGPASTPADLGQRLVAHGMTRDADESMYGMVLRDLDAPTRRNPAVDVRRVPVAEFHAHAVMMARAYGHGLTPETMRPIIGYYESLDRHLAAYLAYVAGHRDPVAFSTAIYDPDGEVVVLGGSATVEECRGQGVYTAMVAARLRAARDRGCTTAIVQAVQGTSAPICQRLGFTIACPLDLYVWTP